MKLLVDMNMSPRWVNFFEEAGFVTVHWSSIGAGNEADSTIMTFARENSFVVVTFDLDFGILLARNKTAKPSVIQLRSSFRCPEDENDEFIQALREHEAELTQGALLTITRKSPRIRLLPIV